METRINKEGDNVLHIHDNIAVLWTQGSLPNDSQELLESTIFCAITKEYVNSLEEKDSPIFEVFPKGIKIDKAAELATSFICTLGKKKVTELSGNEDFYPMLKDLTLADAFVKGLFNYWRSFERFLVLRSPAASNYDGQPYRAFNATIEELNHQVRKAFREIRENITGAHPRIYRQTAAGFEIGVIAARKDIPMPKDYDYLNEIPVIRQLLIEPPLILDPPMNKRRGMFTRVDENPLEGVDFSDGEWLCYPAKVGDLIIHTYFHNKFTPLGCSLANLFDLAWTEDLAKKPDAIYAYGVPAKKLERFGDLPTVFYDDEKNGMLVGVVPEGDEYGYFGYLKKMILTLHNIIMMKRGRMPIHGAMVKITLKNGKSANIVIMGDSGAGKSESLEAFRYLARDNLSEMIIIFDDMGSFEIDDKGVLRAYGTESGAFMRLDDLSPGFAFDNLDRSIIMSPQKLNARALIPVTTIEEILRGYKVDYFLYANNYEPVEDGRPHITRFNSPRDAMDVFSKGMRMSKGTTDTSGVVSTYYGNLFGPAQYKALHEDIAKRYFKTLFDNGTYVGELKTLLGVKGFEKKGPQLAAKALLEAISKKS